MSCAGDNEKREEKRERDSVHTAFIPTYLLTIGYVEFVMFVYSGGAGVIWKGA